MALCSLCRNTLLRRLHPFRSIRAVSTVPVTSNTASITPPSPTAPETPPQATSSVNPASSQPFSTPQFAPATLVKAAKIPKKGPRIPSRVPGGGVLQGLGYTKAKPNILAKEDDEYPPWLWTLLDKAQSNGTGAAKADVAGKYYSQRHMNVLTKVQA